YLQLGRYDDARRVLDHLDSMKNLLAADFKGSYAATAMPVRFAVEQNQWDVAAKIEPISESPAQVAAIAVWARGQGRTRRKQAADASGEIADLQKLENEVHRNGDDYWAAQVGIMGEEVAAWNALANSRPAEAETLMRKAADEEDAMEKSPATPGPVVPAREQLGELLLQQHRPADAMVAFRISLVNAPGRRGSIEGLSQAVQLVTEK
ncbi:MAG: hypothetical protein WBQ95_17420, partial [Terracidiphilus sp.]